MKTFYLLRHAHTIPAAPPLMSDHERTLSPQGVQGAQAVGAFMRENAFLPDFVLCSSAVRTVMTAKLVLEAGAMTPRLHIDRHFYQAPADHLIEDVRLTDDSIGALLLVCHNPGVSDLARALGGEGDCAPGTLNVFQAACDSWADFSPNIATFQKVFVP